MLATLLKIRGGGRPSRVFAIFLLVGYHRSLRIIRFSYLIA
jgi:hypothetical protein